MLTELPGYQALAAHFQTMADLPMSQLFADNPQRFEQFSGTVASLTVDYSKNRLTADTLELLTQLATQAGLPDAIKQLFAGDIINTTERRAAQHMALRYMGDESRCVAGRDVMPEVRQVRQQMAAFYQALIDGKHFGATGERITDVVNIGIGGSDLGPALVTESLAPYHTGQVRVHFVANVDSSDLGTVLQKLDPARTLFIVVTKSFSTQETIYNAETAKDWIVNALGPHAVGKHFAAVTAKAQMASAFGILPETIFPIWDWVGGRFSVWSAVGLSVMCAIGVENFFDFLRGAEAVDQHFGNVPLQQNLPVILALISTWYINFFGTTSHAVIPYDHLLKRMPAYLQQATMESLGKSLTHDNQPLDYQTGTVIWGTTGSNGQHAFHQLLHQGTQLIPVDFILPLQSHYPLRQHHQHLVANCLSQSKALMLGNLHDDAPVFSRIPGNKPSNTILLPKISPYTLGALLALYEHKIFTQSVLWNINAFDQWGVELGKKLAPEVFTDLLAGKPSQQHDASTQGLINQYLVISKKEQDNDTTTG